MRNFVAETPAKMSASSGDLGRVVVDQLEREERDQKPRSFPITHPANPLLRCSDRYLKDPR